ncbi:hypothetical protein JXC34_01670 [Candidatus Woesearchaeota archaeon]|nr:hypothetical protein [Candidatus Woesearchaeota archaeon]
MASGHPAIRSHGGGMHSSHIHLPMQMLLGIIFLVTGSLLLLKKIGQDYIPFLPEEPLVWVVAVGSVLGGFYLILTKLWRPRLYL